MRCMMQNPGRDTHDLAIAVVELGNGNRVTLCKRDLNYLLDEIDAEEDPEPTSIQFLPRSGLQA